MRHVDELGARVGRTWPMISAAERAAAEQCARIEEALVAERLVPADAAFVVFGSLARGEWTSGSDLDWALLVDGQADEQHQSVIVHMRRALDKLELKGPGPSGTFGGLAGSHELIHRIGGEQDTNRNTTQRILLLIESRNIGGGGPVRERVIRGIYKRYLGDDVSYPSAWRARPRVPQALLNDVVRYWRTVCVDYASKRRERGTTHWGLRNIKLRLSRKLLFSAGLAACLGCRLRPGDDVRRAVEGGRWQDVLAATTEQVLELSTRPPLDTLAKTVLDFGAIPAGAAMFEAYEQFLCILDDGDRRKQLEHLAPDQVEDDAVFAEAKHVAGEFHQGLLKLFFGTDGELTSAAQEYGVF